MNGVRLLRGIVRKILLLSAFLVIAFALLVSVGRETIDELDRYRSNINSYASTLLGLELDSQELQGEWRQLTPQVTAKGLSIYGPGQQKPAITLDHVTLDLDLLQSVLSRHVVWRELQVGRVNLTVREDAEGRWTIAGLPLSGRGGSSGLLDVLFDSDYLEIDLVSLSLEFFSGTESVLEAHDILLENGGGFHRLLAAVNLVGTEQSAELIVEGRGDHRDFKNFDGFGYLKLSRIDFSGSLNALIKGWFPEIIERIGDIETDIKGEVWINLAEGGEANLVGQVSAAEVPLNWLEDVVPLTNFKTEMTGWFHLGEDWGLRLQGLDFDWGELQIEPLDINFRQAVGAEWDNGSLAVSQINLSLLDDLLVKARLAPDAIVDIVQQLQPTGKINSLHLDLSLENETPDVQMRANLDNVSVASWRGAPASRHINGYIEVHNDTGLVELNSPDGFALHYPQVFDDYMEHSAIRGQVKWRWDEVNRSVKVSSGPLEFGGEEGLGRAYFYLDLPFGQTDDKPEMYLSVGINNTHSRYRNRYLPKNLSPGLLDWLDQSVGDTSIPEVGFIWRGALSGGDADLHSLQLYLNLADGYLKFQPDWPPLEQLNAVLTIDDKEVDSQINTATLGNAQVKRSEVRVRSASAGKGLEVLIGGDIAADIGDVINVLAQSPLKSRVEGLSGWQVSGDSRTNLDLTIPLSGGAAGGSYHVDTRLSQARMALTGSEFAFEQLQGVLSYRNGKGLFSREIKGRFWDEPMIASLATKQDGLSVDINGRISKSVLDKFLNLSLDQVIQGKTDVQANLLVPLEDSTSPLRLTLNSQLQGVTINLPAPFGKELDSRREITSTVAFSDNLDIEVAMGEDIQVHLIQKGGVLIRGLLALDSKQTALPEVGQFMVTGHLEHFSLSEWQDAVSPLLSDAGDTINSDESLKPVFDIKIDELDVAGLSFEQAMVTGGYQDEGWQIGVNSDLVAGQILIPQDTASPMVLDLERLSLPTPTEAGGDADALDPRNLPHLQLSVKKFSVGNKLFGEASFLMEPQSNGVRVSGIDANLLGLQVGGEEYDTSLEWTLEDGRHRTLVDGMLRAGDLGDVMEAWGLPQILDSDEAHFFTEMTWPGRPWEISTTTMKGAMSLQLQKGRFYQAPKGATKQMIRLVSLFNFDNWMRRLRLDFSDLFEEGMSYDEMQGGLIFDEGTLTFDAPIVVKLPSGRVRLEGVADLMSEDIDAHLVTTLPLGTNLPWIVALAGGLPAAAGVYITGKVFKKQVDKLSSISYRITGPWSDPEILVERVFSDSTSSNKKSNNKSGGSASPSTDITSSDSKESDQ
ncbi:MAG: YhdP family protein [Porticoccus sp.]|nr:YhdP family protein [Porticoccus sp.]